MNHITDITVLKELSEVRSQSGGTSLVTLYVPPGQQITQVSSMLCDELSTSQQIKSRQVSNAVGCGLRSAIYKMKNYHGNYAPENGFVLCAGEVESCF